MRSHTPRTIQAPGSVHAISAAPLLSALTLAWFCITRPAWGQDSSPWVRVDLATDRTNIYQYETFELTVSMASSGIRLDKTLTLEALPDSNTLVMGPLEALPIQRELQGQVIRETRRYRARCRALKSGTLRLAPSATALQIVRRRSFFGRQWVKRPIRLSVTPITIPIAPLPPPPDGVQPSGAVGDFTFTVTADPLDVAVGDLIKLRSRIAGEGYLEAVQSPTVQVGSAFKVYPPRLRSRSRTAVEFEQALIPLNETATEIPPLAFTSFNARQGHYQTQTQGPFHVQFHTPREVDRSQVYRPATPTDKTPVVTTLADRIDHWKATPDPHGEETVIVLKPTTTHLAPADMARALFECKAGDIVSVEEESGAWLRIRRHTNSGWIRSDTVMRRTGKE